MRRILLLAAVLALVTAACKIETNFAATIEADGTGVLVAELGFDDEAKDLLLQGGADPFEGNDLANVPGATTSEETRGDMTFYLIEVPFDDVEQLEQGLLGNENALVNTFDVTVTPDRVTVNGTADAETLGDQAEGFDPALFEESVSANIKLTLPGRILSHNADSQDGNTLMWEVPIFGGTLDIQAESDPTQDPAGDGGGFPIWLIVLIVVVVVGAIAYFVVRGRSGGGTSTAEAPTAPEPEGDAMPPTPPPAE
jgi:hypothetical protein